MYAFASNRFSLLAAAARKQDQGREKEEKEKTFLRREREDKEKGHRGDSLTLQARLAVAREKRVNTALCNTETVSDGERREERNFLDSRPSTSKLQALL